MRKIICAGCHRSGSTWLFNTIRIALQLNGTTFYSCFSSEYNPKQKRKKKEFLIIKTHRLVRRCIPSYRIYTTIRDLRDIAASAIRRGLIENEPAAIVKYISQVINWEYEAWKPYSNLEIIYEHMYKDKIRFTKIITDDLGLKVDPKKVHEKVEGLPIPETGMDKSTQLHHNHITLGKPRSYRRTLQKDAIRAIHDTFREWMKEHHYI